jgi:hypothetical protein
MSDSELAVFPLLLAVSQVEHWLENLHDRRRLLEIAWQNRKTHLEQCLALALLASDLKGLEEVLVVGKEALARGCDHLGNSPASAELLLHEHKKLFPEAKVNAAIDFFLFPRFRRWVLLVESLRVGSYLFCHNYLHCSVRNCFLFVVYFVVSVPCAICDCVV